ncbi:PDZ domain-containing protein [Vampirovibrio sp.]|uniref:PDZ domain-containing protein n=1 Tax=Vampirovibrio sp. TaxID=2717857 RepID=UPI003593B25B
MRDWISGLKGFCMFTVISCLCGAGFTEAAPPVKQGKAKQAPTAKSGKPFVIQETYREALPGTSEKGVVGLDMLIEPNHYPVIQKVFKGTPAQLQGIRVGDTILAINGVRAVQKTLSEVDRLISDIPGDVVNLVILRDGKPKKYSLTVMSLGQTDPTVRQSFAGLTP